MGSGVHDRGDAADGVFTPLRHFEGARRHTSHEDRLRHVRRAAAALRDELLSGASSTRTLASFDIVCVPYPTKYGLRDATWVPTPYLHITNRVFVVRFDTAAGRKTLLVGPVDRAANAETPFFRDLAQPLGGSEAHVTRAIWPELGRVEAALDLLGIDASEVDYITYDHLHTQDLRRWLGGGRPYFPNAKLLVTRAEWVQALAPLPLDRRWYCPNGLVGVDERRVVFLESDVLLGRSVALVRTPGHTEGNHSIAISTRDGIFVISENGVSADSYAPTQSRIPGLARWARTTGAEVVLNGNTLHGTVDQYLSMILEKTLAGPSHRHPEFPNVAPSSELTAHRLSPGLAPTFHVGPLRIG